MAINSLLIEYDEAAQEIKFYEVSADRSRHLAIKVPLAHYQEKEPDEAERVLGETVFTFFDHWSDVKMGLRDYEGQARASLASRRKSIATLALQADAEAQYQLAIDCFTSGVRNRSVEEIVQADLWLKKAASNGSVDAIEYLGRHWERDRESALRSIRDR